MRWLVPCLSALAIVGVAVGVVVYQRNVRRDLPTAPNEIVHIADYHWIPEDQYVADDDQPMTYAEFLDRVDRIQLQQMDAIRILEVRDVWVEGQSDKTIDEFREHILALRDVKPPAGDSPVDQLIRDKYREDLLQIGAAGRLLLAGEIDDVWALEDHEAWRAAKPVNGIIDPKANEARERAMVRRLPSRAVIVLGAGHDLAKWIPGEFEYLVERVEALPAEK